MKFRLLLFFLFIYTNANSQSFKINRLGLRVETSMNIYNSKEDDFLTVRPIITYDISKFQIGGGIVLSDIYVVVNELACTYVDSHLSITGGTIEGKYNLISSKKSRTYIFMESMILNFHTYQGLEYIQISNQGRKPVLIGDSNLGNKTFLFQPIIGCCWETKFFKFITFSIDFGLGFTVRKLKYDNNSWASNYNNSKSLKSYTGQLKLSLGFNLN